MNRYQRYNREHPTISIRLSKQNYEMFKKMAKGKALGPYCANTLLNLHCNNCKAMLKKRGAEIRKFLDAQDVIKSLYKENESLKANAEDWQGYSAGLQDEIKTLKTDLKPSEQYTEVQEKAELLQHKLDESEKSNLDIQADWDRLNSENAKLCKKVHSQNELERKNAELRVIIHSQEKVIQINKEKEADLEDVIQGYKESEADLQRKIEEWVAWWGTVVGDKSNLLQNLAEEVGVSQAEILKDLIEYSLAHSGDIYIENLEAQ